MRPKPYEIDHRALGFYMMSTPSHHTYFKKKFMTQKPKFEIGQEVYYKGVKHVIEGIKLSYMVGQDYLFYLPNGIGWIYEKDLTLDNKKYYILYRSADGLEKTDEIQATDNLHGAGITRTRHLKSSGPRCSLAKGQRKYQFVSKTTNWDSLTETYIYDEVI